MQKVNALQQSLSQKLSSIPKDKRLVVTSHDAFNYLGKEFSISFIAPVGVNTDIEPTASDVAKLIDQIKSQNIKALFIENINNPRLLRQIALRQRLLLVVVFTQMRSVKLTGLLLLI